MMVMARNKTYTGRKRTFRLGFISRNLACLEAGHFIYILTESLVISHYVAQLCSSAAC